VTFFLAALSDGWLAGLLAIPVCRGLLVTSNKTRPQQSGTERIDGNARTRPAVMLVVASKSVFVPSLIHTCRATPRRQQPPRCHDDSFHISVLPALSGQRVRNIVGVRVRRVQSNRRRWMAWHSQAFSK
jgi:hypothetical protein